MSERLDPLDFEDDGASLSLDDYGSGVTFRAIDDRAEIEVFLTVDDVDKVIAWLATWKENQES